MSILKIGGDYTPANNFAVTTFLNINSNNTSNEDERPANAQTVRSFLRKMLPTPILF